MRRQRQTPVGSVLCASPHGVTTASVTLTGLLYNRGGGSSNKWTPPLPAHRGNAARWSGMGAGAGGTRNG